MTRLWAFGEADPSKGSPLRHSPCHHAIHDHNPKWADALSASAANASPLMGAAMHGSRPWRRRRKPAVFGLFPLLAMMWAVADGQQLRGQETGGAKGGSSGAGCVTQDHL